METEPLKQAAAERAVDAVHSGMRVGLGTGSTVRWVLRALGRRLAAGALRDVVGVATSLQTEQLAREVGIPLAPLDARVLDLALDGADEIDPQLQLIKGHGGALVRERLVALQARELLIVADHTKLVPRLGTRAPVPLELLPFGCEATLARIAAHCGRAPVLRRSADGAPVFSENGHPLADLSLGVIADPGALFAQLKAMAGVVDCGLFLDLARRAFVAHPDGVREHLRTTVPDRQNL
jgi:ribose 5-phosphate isomerase A